MPHAPKAANGCEAAAAFEELAATDCGQRELRASALSRNVWERVPELPYSALLANLRDIMAFVWGPECWKLPPQRTATRSLLGLACRYRIQGLV